MDVNPVPRRAPAGRSSRSLAGLAIAAAVALTLASPGAVFAWDPNAYSSADEQLLVTLTNQSRAAAGLPALTVDPALAQMARWRSKDMVDRGYFSHTIPPDGKKVFDYLTASGYCYVLAGENIGTNNFPDDSATETIHQGFMGSAGHRANILGSDWEVIGIGAYKGANGSHMWTVLFADRCGGPPVPAPTATPTPRPTASPATTPAPTAAPTATSPPQPSPTAAPTLAPTRAPTPPPTATPARSAAPEPADTPGPVGSPEPTFGPTEGAPSPTPAPSTESIPGPATTPALPAATVSADEPSAEPTATEPTAAPSPRAAAMRVIDPPFASGLVDRIVGDVAAGFFGH